MKTLYLVLGALLIVIVSAQEPIVNSFNTMSSLVQANPNQVNNVAIVRGVTNVTDGLAGVFFYDFQSLTATNATNVFKPLRFGGRWERVIGNFQTNGIGGGGGDTIWTTNSSLGGLTIQPADTTSVLQIIGNDGGYYFGTSGAISNNWTSGSPIRGDALIIEQNGDFGETPTLNLDIENSMDSGFTIFTQTTLSLATNRDSLIVSAKGNARIGEVSISCDPDANQKNTAVLVVDGGSGNIIMLLGDGTMSVSSTISAGRTNQVQFGPQIAPAGTTNITFNVDGQWYQVLATPIGPP